MSNKICSVEGCNGKLHGLGYCSRHYQQFKKYGKITHTGRSEKDLNEIIKYDDYAEIILYDKQCNEKARVIIDLEDVDKCKKYKWCLKDDNKYVINTTSVGYIHRFIMDCPKDMTVDHINGNKLDNRKSNLRICTMQENNFNNKIYTTNNTGYPGVDWYKKTGKWRARIQVNGKNIHLGLFDNIEDAINVRKQAEIKYFGEYRRGDNNE